MYSSYVQNEIGYACVTSKTYDWPVSAAIQSHVFEATQAGPI